MRHNALPVSQGVVFDCRAFHDFLMGEMPPKAAMDWVIKTAQAR